MKHSLSRRITYAAILILLLFIFTESLLSIAYYQTYGGSPLATLGLFRKLKDQLKEQKATQYNTKVHQLVRPNSSEKVNQLIAEEAMSSNGFEYRPWIGYSSMNFSGKYINTKDLIRQSIPQFYKGINQDTIRIYFFGGSTMFGFNIADHETIPSQFIQMLKGSGIPSNVQVFNYGIPTYYSYHELILLTHLLFNGHRPDIIIFLDGLNDLIGVRATTRRVSFIDYKFKETFKTDLQWGNPAYKDSFKYILTPHEGTDLRKLSDTLLHQYLATKSTIEKISEAYKIKSFFFIQPVPYYNYPNQRLDPFCNKERNPQFGFIYPKLEAEAKSSSNLFFLGNLLKDEKSIPFIDGFHYSPSFIQKISKSIVENIKSNLL